MQEQLEIDSVQDVPPTYGVYENLLHSANAVGLDQAWVDHQLRLQSCHILDAATMIGFSWTARNTVLDAITKIGDQQRAEKLEKEKADKKAAAKAERAAKKAQAEADAKQEAADSAEQTAEDRATMELHVLNEKDRILAKHEDTAWLEHVWNVAEREHGVTWACLAEFKHVLKEGGKDDGDDTRAVPETQGAPDQSAPEVGNDGSDQDQKPEKTPKERLADLYLLASEEKIPTTQVNQWWDQITGGHLSIFGVAELSKLDELIYLERMKNRKPATPEDGLTRNPEGQLVDAWGEVIDVPAIFKEFDLVEMPTLDDPNILDIVDKIGDKIAEHQEAAARYIKNAEAKGEPRLKKAAQIEQVFGHLIFADAIKRLPKYTRDCKGGKAGEPSKKSYVYPSFVVSFKKEGGFHCSNKKALDAHLTAMSDEELAALGLRKREVIDNEWDEIKELVKADKLPADMPGTIDLPVDHYAKRTIKPTKDA